MEDRHPLHDAEIRVFQEIGRDNSFRAFVGKGDQYALFFDAETMEGAVLRAKAWKDETLAKHEAAYIARQQHLAEIRAKRKAKEKA